MVMVEAMACGTPVIAYPCGSVPEVIDDGITGFIVNTIEEAVKALERVPDFDRKECRETFEKRFTASRMAHDYLRVYKRLVGKQSADADPAEGQPVGRTGCF